MSSESRRDGVRWKIKDDCKEVLEHHYVHQRFPSPQSRKRLAEVLDVEPRRIQVWFQNRRQREKAGHDAEQPANRSAQPSELQNSLERLPRPESLRDGYGAGALLAPLLHDGLRSTSMDASQSTETSSGSFMSTAPMDDGAGAKLSGMTGSSFNSQDEHQAYPVTVDMLQADNGGPFVPREFGAGGLPMPSNSGSRKHETATKLYRDPACRQASFNSISSSSEPQTPRGASLGQGTVHRGGNMNQPYPVGEKAAPSSRDLSRNARFMWAHEDVQERNPSNTSGYVASSSDAVEARHGSATGTTAADGRAASLPWVLNSSDDIVHALMGFDDPLDATDPLGALASAPWSVGDPPGHDHAFGSQQPANGSDPVPAREAGPQGSRFCARSASETPSMARQQAQGAAMQQQRSAAEDQAISIEEFIAWQGQLDHQAAGDASAAAVAQKAADVFSEHSAQPFAHLPLAKQATAFSGQVPRLAPAALNGMLGRISTEARTVALANCSRAGRSCAAVSAVAAGATRGGAPRAGTGHSCVRAGSGNLGAAGCSSGTGLDGGRLGGRSLGGLPALGGSSMSNASGFAAMAASTEMRRPRVAADVNGMAGLSSLSGIVGDVAALGGGNALGGRTGALLNAGEGTSASTAANPLPQRSELDSWISAADVVNTVLDCARQHYSLGAHRYASSVTLPPQIGGSQSGALSRLQGSSSVQDNGFRLEAGAMGGNPLMADGSCMAQGASNGRDGLTRGGRRPAASHNGSAACKSSSS